jgi:hypothetical protein
VSAARPLLALGVCAALAATAGVAGAATPKVKPACNLLTDAAGDATGSFIAEGLPTPNEDAVDIVSGDVATKGRVLTSVLRVKKLSESSLSAPGGLHWKFFFNVDGTQVFTQAVAEAGAAPTFVIGTIDEATGTSTTLGDVTGVIEVAKNEVRVTAPFSILPATPKPGSKITSLEPNAGRYVNAVAVSFSDSTDTATSSNSYTVGAPSCVAVGK